MGKKDTKAKEYMSNNERFADLCNFLIRNGEKVVSADSLIERDTTEMISVLDMDGKEAEYYQKARDLLKNAIIKTNNKAVFVLIGIENQSDIHYAMPVKSMVYDALDYDSQVKKAATRHKEQKDFKTNAEFLSGFAKTDKLIPIIPITLYLGTEEWDAPTSLHEMFDEMEEWLKPFVPDYKINLIAPDRLTKEDLDKFKQT